jgi:hypothetical protein
MGQHPQHELRAFRSCPEEQGQIFYSRCKSDQITGASFYNKRLPSTRISADRMQVLITDYKGTKRY